MVCIVWVCWTYYSILKQLLWLLPLPVAGAVQQAEGFPGGGTGLQEAGFGPGLHGTTPGATRPAHSLKTAPALSLWQTLIKKLAEFVYQAALLCHSITTQTFRSPLNIIIGTWSMKVKKWDIVLGYCIFYQGNLNSDKNWLRVELLGSKVQVWNPVTHPNRKMREDFFLFQLT